MATQWRPLEFQFGWPSGPPPEASPSIVDRYARRHELDAAQVNVLYSDLLTVAQARLDFYTRGIMLNTPVPYGEELHELETMIQRVEAPLGWDAPVHATFRDMLNGPQGPPTPWDDYHGVIDKPFNRGLYNWTEARVMLDKWNTPDGDLAAWDSFYKAFTDQACTEWGKMDETDKSFGGAWAVEAERDNAWNLCHERNARALFNLPYPKHAVLWTVDYGCRTRRESVPHSKMLCEWMRRKLLNVAAAKPPAPAG